MDRGILVSGAAGLIGSKLVLIAHSE